MNRKLSSHKFRIVFYVHVNCARTAVSGAARGHKTGTQQCSARISVMWIITKCGDRPLNVCLVWMCIRQTAISQWMCVWVCARVRFCAGCIERVSHGQDQIKTRFIERSILWMKINNKHKLKFMQIENLASFMQISVALFRSHSIFAGALAVDLLKFSNESKEEEKP